FSAFATCRRIRCRHDIASLDRRRSGRVGLVRHELIERESVKWWPESLCDADGADTCPLTAGAPGSAVTSGQFPYCGVQNILERPAVKLSVVVPCYNEEAVIDRLIDVLGAQIGAITSDYEVLLVDDGSKD